MHDDDGLHRLLDGNLEELGNFFARVLARCRHFLHRLGGSCARAGRQCFGQLHVGGVFRIGAEGDGVLARGGQHLELVRARAADLPGVRGDRAESQSQAREDARIGVVHRLVALLEARVVRVEGVGVLHRELARAHHAESRTDLVAELGLDLVEVHGQLPVALHFLAQDVAEHFLRGGRVAELAFGAVLDAQHHRAVELPAARLLPQLGGLHGGCEQLEGARAVHFLAHDPLHFLQHPQSERHPRVQAAGELADDPGAQHQSVACQLRFLGGFLERGEVKPGGAHELSWNRRIQPTNSISNHRVAASAFYTRAALGPRLARPGEV